jgi:hypothetical protein
MWSIYPVDLDGGSCERSDGNAYSGNYSVFCDLTENAAFAGYNGASFIEFIDVTEASASYNLSMQVYFVPQAGVTGPFACQVSFSFYAGVDIVYPNAYPGQWSQFTTVYTVADSIVNQISWTLQCKTSETNTQFYVDDISMVIV